MVSAAGFCASDLLAQCRQAEILPTSTLPLQAGAEGKEHRVRVVDGVALRATLPKEPRLRRAGKVTKYSVAAARQAIPEEHLAQIAAGERRLGIVATFLNGGVCYSNRFYSEVLENPAFASPLIFPETVFNAPPSHVAANLGSKGPSYTLWGDSASWVSGLEVAQDWIDDDLVDSCLVLCAEELDPLSTTGLALFSSTAIATEGAAAVYFQKEAADLRMSDLHGPFPYTSLAERTEALATAVTSLGEQSSLMVDGLTGIEKLDRQELQALAEWQGGRLSPARLLGEGMGVRAGFQTVLALQSLLESEERVCVLAAGGNQQAAAASFEKRKPTTS